MNTVITRKFTFDSAHRVLGHEGKCRFLHGHRYEAEVTVSAPRLDNLGRVIDFSLIKERVGTFIDSAWDHNVLLNEDDPLAPVKIGEMAGNTYVNKEVFAGRTPYFMPKDYNSFGELVAQNPTVENIAKVLFKEAYRMLQHYGIKVVHVRVYETANCWADYQE